MRTQPAVLRIGAAISVASMFWLGSVGLAKPRVTPVPAAAAAIERGRSTFLQSCVVCHGDHGKGNGINAPALQPRPSDLTRIARRAGTFSAAQVEATIKGNDAATVHGPPGMIVWNAMFLADANGDDARAEARFTDLVMFLESIQVK